VPPRTTTADGGGSRYDEIGAFCSEPSRGLGGKAEPSSEPSAQRPLTPLSRFRAAAARWWPRWSACGGRPPRASPCVVCVAGRRYQRGTNAARSTSGAQRCAAVAARCPCLRCHRNEANYGCTRTTCARYGSTLRLCYHRRHAVFGHERAGERGHQRGGDAALAERQLGGWQRVHHMRCVPTTAANPPSPPAPPLSLPPSPPPPPAPPSPPAPPQLRLCGGPRIRLLGGETNVAILYVNEAYIYRLCTPPHMRNDAYARVRVRVRVARLSALAALT
jgi:hypothetical protein